MLVSYTKPHNCQVTEWSLEPRAPDPSSLPREFLGLVSKPKAGCKLTPWSMPVRLMAFLGKAVWLALFIQKEQECRVLSGNAKYKVRAGIKEPKMPLSAQAQRGYYCSKAEMVVPHSGLENSRLSLSLSNCGDSSEVLCERRSKHASSVSIQ